MGGFGVLAWLAIGAAGGWTITRLMVTAGDEGLRGTAAGMLGGILGGLCMELFESPWARSNDLHTFLAALAGSVWLAWITCAVTSGRERRSYTRARAVTRVGADGRPLLWNRLQTLAARMGAG